MKGVLGHIVEIHKDHGEFDEYGELNEQSMDEFIDELEREFGQFTNQ